MHPAREHEDRSDSRDHREQDEGLVVLARESYLTGPAQVEDARREPEARDGPGLVHRLVESKSPTPSLGGRHVGDQGIAGCRADALADPVEHADDQHQRPPGGEEQQGLGEARQAVAPERQGLLLADAVRENARDDLEERRRALGQSLDEPVMPTLTPSTFARKSGSVRTATSLLRSLSSVTTPRALTVGSRRPGNGRSASTARGSGDVGFPTVRYDIRIMRSRAPLVEGKRISNSAPRSVAKNLGA